MSPNRLAPATAAAITALWCKVTTPDGGTVKLTVAVVPVGELNVLATAPVASVFVSRLNRCSIAGHDAPRPSGLSCRSATAPLLDASSWLGPMNRRGLAPTAPTSSPHAPETGFGFTIWTCTPAKNRAIMLIKVPGKTGAVVPTSKRPLLIDVGDCRAMNETLLLVPLACRTICGWPALTCAASTPGDVSVC